MCLAAALPTLFVADVEEAGSGGAAAASAGGREAALGSSSAERAGSSGGPRLWLPRSLDSLRRMASEASGSGG